MADKAKLGIGKLNECCDFVGCKRFTREDFESLQEYVNVMIPLAVSIDVLQGEKEMYLGYLLPVITTLIKNTKALRKEGLTYYDSLAECILKAAENRLVDVAKFFDFFMCFDFIISYNIVDFRTSCKTQNF